METSLVDLVESVLPERLTESKRELVALLLDAHFAAASNNNCASNQCVVAMCAAGVDLKSAAMAAMLSIGGHHAPVERIREFLFVQRGVLDRGEIAPGWGNSFYSGSDPCVASLMDRVRLEYPEHHSMLAKITESIGGKALPNIGAYTAVVAQIIGLPRGLESLLVIFPRLPVWAALYHQAQNG